MVTMYYIMSFLQLSDTTKVSFGDTIRMILGLGTWVIAIFSTIFLFYTNSFLIRRRKKEFGLYNILGMGKRNIGVILFWETLIVYVVSIMTGLFIGIALSKMAELALVFVMRGKVSYGISVSLRSVYMAVILYGGIFVLLFLNFTLTPSFGSGANNASAKHSLSLSKNSSWLMLIKNCCSISSDYF